MILILQTNKFNITKIIIPKKQYLNGAISECFDYGGNMFHKIGKDGILAARKSNRYGRHKSKYDLELIVEPIDKEINPSKFFMLHEILGDENFLFDNRIIL